MGFGNSRLGNNLPSIYFICVQIQKLVTSCKTPLHKKNKKKSFKLISKIRIPVKLPQNMSTLIEKEKGC